jgi:galactonate dehydratase
MARGEEDVMRRVKPLLSRRQFIDETAKAAAAASVAAPFVVRAKEALTLRFVTIPDPDGWHPSLRLKGDWLIFEIGDGVLSGFGEASHSKDDERCKRIAADLLERHYRDFALSLDGLARKEREIAALSPDFVTATAFSGLNQALYDLLAKREQVPVWQLFTAKPGVTRMPLYTTINRVLEKRDAEEYSAVVGEVAEQGFEHFKCAPFEAVDGPENALEKSGAGLSMLNRLREQFPRLGMRVDFHMRFVPRDFFELLPALERLRLEWLEEPFEMGPAYGELRERTRLRVAGGELFWGRRRFEELADNGWVHVIMPDVKHVGGFGPLLDVLKMAEGKVEVSPHNPSGPISTAASLHAAAVRPQTVRAIEYAFDRTHSRRKTGEAVENGKLYLRDAPGWGIEPA